MSLRIVHLGKYYHPHLGGIETHVRTLAGIQARHGIDSRVVCISHDPTLPEETRDGPVFVRRWRPRISAAKLDWLAGCSRYLDQLACDVLHLHAPNPSMSLAVLGMRRPVPLVMTHHSDVVGMRWRRWLFSPIERRIRSRASVIAATNPMLAATSEQLQPYADRVVSVPMGMSLETLLESSPEIHTAAQDIQRRYPGPIWVMCGRLVPYKGHAVALRALQQTSGTLIIIGDGPLRAELETLAGELGVADRVRFLGRIASDREVHDYYRAATALWLPSTLPSEAFGLVQVEAMACGCPVINTRIPGSGVSWVSPHEITGLTVPVGDAEALASAARQLVEDPTLRESLARQARHRARTEFDHLVMHERWLRLYRAALQPQSNSDEAESLESPGRRPVSTIEGAIP